MIVSRLTWLQLRSFPIESAGLIAPDLFGLWSLKASSVRTWNLNVSIALFFSAALCMRFLTSSWKLTLFTVTVLMSRGALLTRVGWMSLDLSFSFCVLLWFSALAHHLKTASSLSLLAMWFSLLIGSLLDSSFCALGLVLAVYKWMCLCTHKNTLRDLPPEGALLHPLRTSFASWVRQTASVSDLLIDLVAFAIILGLKFAISLNFRTPGFMHHLQSFDELYFLDFHYLISSIIIFICALCTLKKDHVFFEFSGLFVLATILWMLGASLLSSAFSIEHYKAILLWIEPMVIGLSCAGAVFLLQQGLPSMPLRQIQRKIR